jgi:hypothetical protein
MVIEAHSAGGRAQTTEAEGFLFNRGIHALFLGGPGAVVLDRLGVRVAGAAPPIDRYRLLADGQQHLLPLDPDALAATTYLDVADKQQFGALLTRLATTDPAALSGVSTTSWLADRELRPRVDALVRALIRLSTYADDLDALSADAAVAQQQVAARAGVLYVDGGWARLVAGLSAGLDVRPHLSARAVTAEGATATVVTDDGVLSAGAVVLATGSPEAAHRLLPADPGWGELGAPITAACLNVGTRRVPSPGYLVSVDAPLYGTTQSPPARQAPEGGAVVGVIRYGSRQSPEDLLDMEKHLRALGVAEEDVVVRRSLARMTVSSTTPTPVTGGLGGRPAVDASGLPRVFLAGDWVGPHGLLTDAVLASGHAAGLAALDVTTRSSRVA